MVDAQAETPSVSADAPAEVQTLVTQHESGGTQVPEGAVTQIRTEAPTQTIGGYEVLGELGRGGMGVVYKALQRGLNRVVAVKMILHADHASAEERLRFLREAEALAKLRHENIVQVYEVGEHDGKPFMSLEYVEGGSLDRRQKGSPLPPRDAASLVEKLAVAMQCAHDAGIVHRDLKPANVLLAGGAPSVVGGFVGSPKITDFGLAKKQDEGGLSMSGAILGTPSYMAPEQAAGKGRDVDARTDVYALGAILYECLTGRPPFRAATAMDTMLQVINDEPVSVRALQPLTPPDLETICLKCLQKEPSRRYLSARELAEDMGRYLRGEPVQARPVGRLERGWRWCRRNPVTAGLLTGIGVLLLTVAGVSTVLGQMAWRKAVEAEQKADEAENAREGERQKAAEEARQRKRAEDEEARTQQMLYASRQSLAQSYWQEGNVALAHEMLDETEEHRDTWEHRYLHTMMNHRGQRTFLGHTSDVQSVAFSPDGKCIASGSWDLTIRVWDSHTGQELHTLTGHTRHVQSVSFSPDGRRLVSGSSDGTVQLWNPQTGQRLLTLKGHTRGVNTVGYSPDGKHLVSGSEDQTAKVWDAQTGQVLLTLKGHMSGVLSVCFSPDGKRLASGSTDRTVKLWDARTGQDLLTLQGHALWVASVSFSPDGTRIASGTEQSKCGTYSPARTC